MGRRLRVIATSWSDNPRKGARRARVARPPSRRDELEVTFAGRTEARFERIRVVGPLPLAASWPTLLREHDVYLAASRDDPCSNALLEALACGLPAAFLRSGGHPELVGEGGIGFDDAEELPDVLAAAASRARRAPSGDPRACARRRRRPLSRGAARMSALRAAVLRAYVPARTVALAGGTRGSSSSVTTSAGRSTTTARGCGGQRAGSATTSRRRSWARFARHQAVFHADHFGALRPRWLESSHRLGLSYFHGRPGTPGYPEFDEAYEALRRHAARVDRVQVTHARCEELVLAAGVDPAKVFRIPIGVDIERFPLGDDQAAPAGARKELGIPESAFVVGSFQKDGVGLGEGLEPKQIKGPDTLVAVLERLREHAFRSSSCC